MLVSFYFIYKENTSLAGCAVKKHCHIQTSEDLTVPLSGRQPRRAGRKLKESHFFFPQHHHLPSL